VVAGPHIPARACRCAGAAQPRQPRAVLVSFIGRLRWGAARTGRRACGSPRG
jgi:hypothetical protein